MRGVPTCSNPTQNTRMRLRFTGAIAVIVTAVALGTLSPAAAQETKPNIAEETKPNILFIMGDDIGWMQPSIYHRGLAVGETPNIDRIGNEGAIFMHYYAEQSCTAGRTAFITGMQPVRVGMVLPEIPGSPSYLRAGTPTLARFLLDLGYTTGEFGKNHLGDTTEVTANRERVPRILGLPVPPRCDARGELSRHQQVPDGADRRTALQEHAHPGLVRGSGCGRPQDNDLPDTPASDAVLHSRLTEQRRTRAARTRAR